MEKPKFVYAVHLNAPPEKLWATLTRPDGIIDLKGEVSRAGSPF